ncbi:hypothetical protein NJ7G_0017 [Natrinema sp. J7-2]|nr:hypothetical protein NJ7G_0017 [Natrinema sp. J7-2]
MNTIDDLECETALREISVTGRSTGAGTSTAGELDDRPGVARLRSSVASIATLTPDRLVGGFGVRIARKRSPIELSFLAPTVAPPDGESVDDPELSIVSPSPFARPDHHENAFTYLTQSGRSGRGSQSADAVGPVSDSATQSPTERVFRSDRRSQLHGSRTADRAQATSHEHDGPERRDGIRSSKRPHRRGDVESGVAARSNVHTSGSTSANSGPLPDRSGPIDDDRPQQSTGRTARRQPTRPRTFATRVTWTDAIARRTLSDSDSSERRRSVTGFDPNISRRRSSSHGESLDREMPSLHVSHWPTETTADVTTAGYQEPVHGESASPPALVDRAVPSTAPTAPPSPSRDTAQRPVRHPRLDNRRPMSAADSSPVPTAEEQSIRRVSSGRDGPDEGNSPNSPAEAPASTAVDAAKSASQPLQQPSLRTERRDRETQTVTSARDRGRSTTPSRRQSAVGTAHDGWTPIRAASMPTPARSRSPIDPTTGTGVGRGPTVTDSSGRLERRTDETTTSPVSADGRKRAPWQTRIDEVVGFDSHRSRSQPVEPGTADPTTVSASADRQPSGSDAGRAVAVQSRRPRRHRPTVITSGTDRIPRQSRVTTTDPRGPHDGTAAVESSRSAFVSRESRTSTRTDRTGHETVARGIPPLTATPTMVAPSRTGRHQYPPLELATDARGAHTADGRPSPERQRRFEPDTASVSETPSPPLSTDPTRVVDDYRPSPSPSPGVTTTGRVRATNSPVRAFSSASGRPAGDRRADRMSRSGGPTTDTRSFGSETTGLSRSASSLRTADRDDVRTGSSWVSATERRSASRPPAMQSARQGSELVVDRHSTVAVNSGTVPDEMGSPEPNRRARASSSLRSDVGDSSLRFSAATHTAVGRARSRSDIGDSPDRHAAALRPEWDRTSDTTPAPSSVTAARAGSDGSAREGTVPSWTDTRSSNPAGHSAVAGPSRRDELGPIRAPTRIDSLRSVAATRPTRGETELDVAPPVREPAESRGAASLNSRGPRLAVMGRERPHRSQRGTEVAARSDPIAGPVRSSRREPVAADSPDAISQRHGSVTETVTWTRFDDGETDTRSLERPRSSTASGVTTATPVTVSNDHSPSTPLHSISRTHQPSAAAIEPASPDPTALGAAVASSSHRFGSGTTRRDRTGAISPDSSGRMPVLRLRSERGTSLRRDDRTARPARSRPDSSRTRRERERPTGDTSVSDSGTTTRSTVDAAADVASVASADASPSVGSASARRTRTRAASHSVDIVAGSPDLEARVRKLPTRTTHTRSTDAIISPSRVTSGHRRRTRSEPLTADTDSRFGAEFGRRSTTLQYRSPTVTDPTGSRSQSPRDGRAAVSGFDRGSSVSGSSLVSTPQHRPSVTDVQRLSSSRSPSERSDGAVSRPRSRDWRGRETATRSMAGPAADAASAAPADASPSVGSASGRGTRTRVAAGSADIEARSTDIGARVRKPPTRTTHTRSTNAAVSPSRVSASPRRRTRSEPLTADTDSQFGAEFGKRSTTLQYRSPAVTEPTGSRSQSPRDGRAAVSGFDRGSAAGSSPPEPMLHHRSSVTDAQRTAPDRSSSERNDGVGSRPHSGDWRGTEAATGSTPIDPQTAADSTTLQRSSKSRGVDTTAAAARSRPRSARGTVAPDTSPRPESTATATAEATGVAATRTPRSDRRTPRSVLRTTAAGSSGQSHTTRRSGRTGTAAASVSDESSFRSDSRPARPPTIAVRPGSTAERADASPRPARVEAIDSRQARVGTAATGNGDADALAPTASDRPSTTAGIAGERRRFESRLRMRRRPSTGASVTDGVPSSRTAVATSSLSLRTRDDVSDPTTDAAATSAASGQSRIPNAPKNKPTTNTIESTGERTGVNGMQTSAASDRPSLTYRRSSATDAPSVGQGGPNGSNATPRDSTTPSGAVRESTASRATPGHTSGRERRGSSDRRETGGARTRSGFGSERSQEPAQPGSTVGHDVGTGLNDSTGSGLNDRHRSSIDRPQHPSERRSEPQRGRRSDQDRHSRNRFDSVDLSSGTDPRFDADVDRAVQELYRKLERKIRVERERRGL